MTRQSVPDVSDTDHSTVSVGCARSVQQSSRTARSRDSGFATCAQSNVKPETASTIIGGWCGWQSMAFGLSGSSICFRSAQSVRFSGRCRARRCGPCHSMAAARPLDTWVLPPVLFSTFRHSVVAPPGRPLVAPWCHGSSPRDLPSANRIIHTTICSRQERRNPISPAVDASLCRRSLPRDAQ